MVLSCVYVSILLWQVSNLLKLNGAPVDDRNDELWGFLVAMVISNSGELNRDDVGGIRRN